MIFSAGFPREIISVFFGVVFSGWISKSLLGCSVLPLVSVQFNYFVANVAFIILGSPYKTRLKSPEKPAHLPYSKCICINYTNPMGILSSRTVHRWIPFCPRPGPKRIPVLPVQSFSKCPREASTNKFCGLAWRIIPFSKWLGSPLFISHEKAIWRGNNPI